MPNRTPKIEDLPSSIARLEHFISGSVRFGCATNGSDLDIVFPIFFRREVVNLLPELSPIVGESEYNNGLKIVYNEIVINFIFLHPLDYVAWFKAANMIESRGLMKDTSRPVRHAIHEALVAVVKMSLSGNCVTQKNYKSFISSNSVVSDENDLSDWLKEL